ncbi:MAG TPA: VCBS repeat-containing protein [bacterium]|nr:VCBS repeat-containing protein [bacterium]
MRRWIIIGLGTVFGSNVLNAVTAADFDGDSRDDVAVFRPASGLWAVQGVTRAYFGGSGDEPRPGDYDGDGIADIAIFRPAVGLWAVRGVTRTYFGGSTDTPLAGGGGQRLYDYVVKPNDGADLVAALESDTYRSVFIPSGTYSASTDITIDEVRIITGAGNDSGGTVINLASGAHIVLDADRVTMENLRVLDGGDLSAQIVLMENADGCRLNNIICLDSAHNGIAGMMDGPTNICLYACEVKEAANIGFRYIDQLVNCLAENCEGGGYYNCAALSGCIVEGELVTPAGFAYCWELSNCSSRDCDGEGYDHCSLVTASDATDCNAGFRETYRISACMASGNTGTGFDSCSFISSSCSTLNGTYGFYNCSYVSACYALMNSTANWNSCTQTAACNDGS